MAKKGSQNQPNADKASDTKKRKKPGRKKVTQDATIASQQGLRKGWTRATFIVREEHLENLKKIAYNQRRSHKELIDGILEAYLADFSH